MDLEAILQSRLQSRQEGIMRVVYGPGIEAAEKALKHAHVTSPDF